MIHAAPDGCRLSVDVTGSALAPPLVLIHALGTDASLWQPQLLRLSERFRVWRYDLRGHGLSQSTPGDYSIGLLASDLVSLLDAQGLSRAHLVGLSIGALVALWVACHHPDRVSRLVLANTAARVGRAELWTERIELVRSAGMDAVARLVVDRWFTPGFRERAPAVVAAHRATLARTSPDGYAGCCAALRDADLRPLASRVRAPTLVIASTHDAATPAAEGRWLKDAIPGATLAELDAAHLSNVERPDAFTDAVLGFLHGQEDAP